MDFKISAEERLAAESKQSNLGITVAIIVVCTIFATIGWKLYQNDQAQKRQALVMAKHMAALEQMEREQEALRLEQTRQKKAEQTRRDYQEQQAWIREQHKESDRIKAKKQTVFNDQNYTPKGAVNSIPPPPSRYYQPGETKTRAQVREINRAFNGPPRHPISKTAPWTWETQAAGQGMRKGRVSGRFSYTVTNGRVDTNSVCSNEVRGSIRYRDCRKGAKAYFKNQCRAGSVEACSAQHMGI